MREGERAGDTEFLDELKNKFAPYQVDLPEGLDSRRPPNQ